MQLEPTLCNERYTPDKANYDAKQDMIQCLKNRYQALKMKGMPDVELNLPQYYIDNILLKLDGKKKQISVKDIFKSDHGHPAPKRIFVQGGPGSGKTALATKLAYDWAWGGQEYMTFDIVILLSAADWVNSFESTLIRILDITKLTSTTIDNIFDDPANNILIILDDFERSTAKSEAQLLKIIRSECFPDATVMVLSQSSKIPSASGEFRQFRNIASTGGMDIRHFFQRYITLLGFTKEMGINFIQNHLGNFPDEMQRQIFLQSQRVIHVWKVQNRSYHVTPLELLMLIIVLSEFSDEEASLTEIHKRILELKVNRYLSKHGTPSVSKVNLFDFNVSEASECIGIVRTFSQFCDGILSTKNLSFSHEEILTLSIDEQKLLDLGFLSEQAAIEGIRYKFSYRPINLTMFEFLRAYHLRCNYITPSLCSSHPSNKILVQRPRLASASLWFAFFIGILGNKREELFRALSPYASEYSHYFGTLCHSLLEIPVAEATKEYLIPLLPALWKIPWITNVAFCDSQHHEEILRYGLELNKIKIIRWETNQTASMPSRLKVDRLLLDIQESVTKNAVFTKCSIECHELHCLISGKFFDHSIRGNFDAFLQRISHVSYKSISFEIKEESALLWLPFVCKAASTGILKIPQINWLLCYLREDELMDQITHLVQNNKVEGLQLVLCGQQMPDSRSDVFYGAHSMQRQTSVEQRQVTKAKISELLDAAAESVTLKRLVINNKKDEIKVDLASLCKDGKKPWKLVQLFGVKIKCKLTRENLGNCRLKIQSLDLSSAIVSKKDAAALFKCCKVKSLACSMKLLTCADDGSPIIKSLKAMDVKIDEHLYQIKYSSFLQKFEHLQILAVSMASLDTNLDPFPLKMWIMKSQIFLPLKGFEVWGIELNPQLALNITKSIVECIEGVQHPVDVQELVRPYDFPPAQLKLTYVLFNVNLVCEDKNVITIGTFVDMVSCLKPSLKAKLLPRVEIVCFDDVVTEMSTNKPNDMTSWVDVFPAHEGFQVAHDFWGMSEDEPYRNREVFNSCPGEYNRFSIKLGENANNTLV